MRAISTGACGREGIRLGLKIKCPGHEFLVVSETKSRISTGKKLAESLANGLEGLLSR